MHNCPCLSLSFLTGLLPSESPADKRSRARKSLMNNCNWVGTFSSCGLPKTRLEENELITNRPVFAHRVATSYMRLFNHISTVTITTSSTTVTELTPAQSSANPEKKQGSLLGDAGRLPGGGVRTGSRTMSRKFLKQSME